MKNRISSNKHKKKHDGEIKQIPARMPSEDSTKPPDAHAKSPDKHAPNSEKYVGEIMAPKKWEETDVADKIMANTTIAIAIFTGFLLVCTGIQTCNLIEATHVENRAYIAVGKIIPDTLIDGKPIKATVSITNTGKTPAYEIDHEYAAVVVGEITKTEIDDTQKRYSTHSTATVIGAGLNYSLIIDLSKEEPLRRGLAAQIYNGTKRLYFIGKITYTDKFGDKHFTHYNAAMNPKDHAFDFSDYYNDGD